MTPAKAAVERHPHLGEPQPVGRLRLDLHTHTMWSGDSTTTPQEYAAAVGAAGLDVVCITDHNAIDGADTLRDHVGCAVVVGEEVRTATGELIGLFLTERVPMGMSAADTARAIRDQGGVVYVPHPFDPMRRCLTERSLYELAEAGLLDAVEVVNAKTSLASLNRRAAEFATRFDLAAGAGSDAHVPDALGAAFVEVDGPGAGPSGPITADRLDGAWLLAALRSGVVLGHHWDEPRPWTPRVIPSV